MLPYIIEKHFYLSNCLFYVPDEGSEPQHWAVFIKMFQFCEEGIHLMVVDYRDDCAGKSGPRMAAIMRLSLVASTPFHIAEGCVAAAVALSQYIDYLLIMSLVECYKYRFHCFVVFVIFIVFVVFIVFIANR